MKKKTGSPEDISQFQTLIQSAMDGCCRLDAQGRLLEVNDSFRQMTGYAFEELPEAGISGLGESDGAVLFEEIRSRIDAGRARFEARLRRGDGSLFVAELSAAKWPAADGFLVFIREKPRESQTEALRESEERYRQLFELSPDGVVILDPETARPLEFNETACRQLGYTREEFERLTLADIDVNETPEEIRSRIQEVLTYKRADFETRQRAKQGNIRNIRVTAQMITVSGRLVYHCIWRDITAQYQARQALRDSEERQRLALEQSQSGGWELDLASHAMQRTPIFDRVFGYEVFVPQWTFEKFLEHVVPEDRAAVERCFLEEKHSNWNFDCRINRQDGEMRWIRVLGGHLSSGEHAGRMAGIVQDITERKLAEEKLRQVNRELHTISECNQALVRARDEQTFLNDICRIICDEGGYRMAWVGIAKHDADKTVSPMASGGVVDGYLDNSHISWGMSEHGQGPTGRCIRSGQVVYISDFATDRSVVPWRDHALRRGYRSSIALPLPDADGNILGALAIYSAVPDAFTLEEIRILTELAQDTAYGIVSLRQRAERQRAEQALRESEEKYRLLFDNAGDAIFIHDVAEGRILATNRKAVELYGYSLAELLSMKLEDLDSPEDGLKIKQRMTGILERGNLSFEVTHLSKDGQKIPVEVNARSLIWNGQPAMMGLCRDLTKRRKAEKEYQTLFREMVDGFARHEIILDENGRPVDYRFLTVNPAFERLTGLLAENIIGKTARELMPSLEQRWIDVYGRVALTGDPVRFDNYSTDLGKYYDVTAFRPAPNQFACFFSDITDRKKIEMALKESEALLKESQRIARVGHYVFHIQEDRWTCSEMLDEIFGIDRDFVRTSASWLQIVHPDDRAEMSRYLREDVIARKMPFDRRYRIINRKDGSTRWVFGQGTLQKDSAGNLVTMFGIIQDITNYKRSEEALWEAGELNQTIIENAQEGIIVYGPDLRYKVWNNYMENLSGFPAREVLGKHPVEVFPFLREQGVLDKLQKAITGECVYQTSEIPFLVPQTNRSGWVSDTVSPLRDQKGEITGVIGTVRDITERKINEELMAARLRIVEFAASCSLEEVLRTAIDEAERLTGSQMGFYHFVEADQRTLSLQFWSTRTRAEFCRVEGRGMHNPVETAGVWTDCVRERGPVIHNNYASLPHRKGLPEGHPAVVRELVIPVFRNDRIVSVMGVGNKPVDYGERDVKALSYLADVAWEIAKRKRTEEEREKLQVQLTQAQKMESVGRLAGGVAHDFNNKLGVVLGYTEMLLRQSSSLPPGAAEDLKEIKKAAEFSARLTEQLLAFARKQVISPKVLDLNETVEGMLKMLRRLIGENIDLGWHPGAELWPVKIDPGQVDQILANLCVNARDAISGTGQIAIKTANLSLDAAYCSSHSGATPGDYVLLSVFDNGAGMDEATQENIFEPFFTTKELGQGTGLGLATVFGIVKQNNGFISVESALGKGCAMLIHLPRHDGAAPGKPFLPDEELSEVKGKETILVVEDEITLLQMTQAMLEQQGYTIFAARTPTQAMRIAMENPADIHLLLTDVILPEMNGKILADKLASVIPGLPCLFMSGYTGDAVGLKDVDGKRRLFIQKPFQMQGLAQKVREALDGK